VEDETLSCGTGVVAASISNYLFTGTNQNKIEVQAEGGKLQVEFEYDGKVFSNIKLIGAAEKVFEGCVSI
jgi:diaminopimelate epimerase